MGRKVYMTMKTQQVTTRCNNGKQAASETSFVAHVRLLVKDQSY
jgi:hypothetical protein